MSTEKRGRNHPFFARSEQVTEVIAHRGGGGEWPQETTYAFDRAVKTGVDVLEMDVHKTSDNHLVLMHDPNVDKTTGHPGFIKKMTSDEVKALDAAAKWPSLKGTGIQVPELEEVFGRYPKARMVIEIKQKTPPLIDELCELIRAHGKTEEVLVASFSDEVLKDFRGKCPEVATSASPFEAGALLLVNSFLKGDYRPDTDALQIPWQLSLTPHLNQKIIAKARELDLAVHAFTVNKPEEMETWINLRVDGIITDYPTTLLKLMGRANPA
ncbi:MAG TPA: glycerophosphodiester phosphodiesterase [Pyrinomonadaceae bacterium]|nr:glycerophosphodiester phosphodiesterase [Pyrinomonadaceae bacterium]